MGISLSHSGHSVQGRDSLGLLLASCTNPTLWAHRGGDQIPCRDIHPPAVTQHSPSSGQMSIVGQHLKSRDAPKHSSDCITNQASQEQKPSPGSLCGENSNRRTLGSCLRKAERAATGRVSGSTTGLPEVWCQCLDRLALPEKIRSKQRSSRSALCVQTQPPGQ